jgi:hypothetical protein
MKQSQHNHPIPVSQLSLQDRLHPLTIRIPTKRICIATIFDDASESA